MPGPGDYDTLKADNILRRNVSIFIGKSSRPNQERSDSPGRECCIIQRVNTGSRMSLV